jgi:hypothetical protein
MISRYGVDRENHPSFDGAVWCVAIGGVTKGRIYGAPVMSKSMVSTSVHHNPIRWSQHLLAHQCRHWNSK